MSARLWLVVALFAALSLGGCKGKGKKNECSYASDCLDGQACIKGRCKVVTCTSSVDCQIQQYCTDKHECVDGCETSSDCRAGEFCGSQSRQCQPAGCRSTDLDCELGQYCDTTTGQCYEASQAHCAGCDAAVGSCPEDGTCWVFETGDRCTSDSQCPSGWHCDLLEAGGDKTCHQDFCLQDCDPDDAEACPRGYQCGDVSGRGDYQCFADCAWLEENGY